MNIRQEPLKDNSTPRGIARPLLSHTQLDKAAPWIRTLLGVAFIAFGGYTTVAGVGADFAPLLVGANGQPDPMLVLVAGLGVAAFLSLGEWLTSESVPFIYVILILIDARYTQGQIGPWISKLAAHHLEETPQWVAPVVSFLVSWLLAIAIARYGEILLFGKRKRGK